MKVLVVLGKRIILYVFRLICESVGLMKVHLIYHSNTFSNWISWLLAPGIAFYYAFYHLPEYETH